MLSKFLLSLKYAPATESLNKNDAEWIGLCLSDINEIYD